MCLRTHTQVMAVHVFKPICFGLEDYSFTLNWKKKRTQRLALVFLSMQAPFSQHVQCIKPSRPRPSKCDGFRWKGTLCTPEVRLYAAQIAPLHHPMKPKQTPILGWCQRDEREAGGHSRPLDELWVAGRNRCSLEWDGERDERRRWGRRGRSACGDGSEVCLKSDRREAGCTSVSTQG